VTLKSEIITKDQATATFAHLLSHSHEKEAFVFVHGFNNRYEDAVYRFAQILHDSEAGADVAPILFTWPSAGNVFAYEYDQCEKLVLALPAEAVDRNYQTVPARAVVGTRWQRRRKFAGRPLLVTGLAEPRLGRSSTHVRLPTALLGPARLQCFICHGAAPSTCVA
jgi:hypothetical protein